MPCLNTTLTRPAIQKTTRKKKTKHKISRNKKFTAETPYLNLKAPSNHVKMHLDETLTTQI